MRFQICIFRWGFSVIKKISLLLMLLIAGNNAFAMTPEQHAENERCESGGRCACGATLTGVCLATALFVMFYNGGTSGDCDITNSTGRGNITNCTNASRVHGTPAPLNETDRSTLVPPPSRQSARRRLK